MKFIMKEVITISRKGPAKGIGQDGPVVFIRHGGQLVKARICHIQSTNPHKPEQEIKAVTSCSTHKIDQQEADD